MIIATVAFGDPIFKRMARVLEYSASVHCPSAQFIRIDAPPHQHIKGIPTHCPANAHKKQYWSDIVHEHPDEQVVLMDCDTLILGDISDVFDCPHKFDIAYTVREHRVRINAGVMFVNTTHAARRFFDKWMYTQQVFLSEQERPHLNARLRQWAGLDQAALAAALKAVDFPFKRIELPCEIYNSVDQTWSKFSDQTKVLHVKGNLRRFGVIQDDAPEKHPTISKPMRVWREYEKRALTQGVCHVTT